jgi:hypothetical protein
MLDLGVLNWPLFDFCLNPSDKCGVLSKQRVNRFCLLDIGSDAVR